MKKYIFLSIIITACALLTLGFRGQYGAEAYQQQYLQGLQLMRGNMLDLRQQIQDLRPMDSLGYRGLVEHIHQARMQLKKLDFWLRYLEPNAYRLVNGPLPVEYEVEAFEKFEAPYTRHGGGLSLLELNLNAHDLNPAEQTHWLDSALKGLETFEADSVTRNLQSPDAFFFCNRLFLLNLATIYTTGFECPDPDRIIPELKRMTKDVQEIYHSFNQGFSQYALSPAYSELYGECLQWLQASPDSLNGFDQFTWLKQFINPLFRLNQQMIRQYQVSSRSLMDFSLNKQDIDLLDKNLYRAQHLKGVFSRVADSTAWHDILDLGRTLFYDPILSGNLQRSCASCHNPLQCFTDTTFNTAMGFDAKNRLKRNTPSLVNAPYQQLLMWDGKHTSLEQQCLAVMTNPEEMNAREDEIMERVLSCPDYKKTLNKLAKQTPLERRPSIQHIISALIYYYRGFSTGYSAFDRAVRGPQAFAEEARRGFNLFMGKAQCGTCHFLPQFNGVKPPYLGSEFEVLGTAKDNQHRELDADSGRAGVFHQPEMLHAFRTPGLRNLSHTAPYMHNGSLRKLNEVVDFYDAGGGAGHGLKLDNQTLSSDSLKLNPAEKRDLIAFLRSLDEDVPVDKEAVHLPASKQAALNNRRPGGNY